MKVFNSGQLRIARRNAKLTLREAAKALNFSASCIAGKENGIVRGFADELHTFAKIYNVSLETFLLKNLTACVNDYRIE